MPKKTHALTVLDEEIEHSQRLRAAALSEAAAAEAVINRLLSVRSRLLDATRTSRKPAQQQESTATATEGNPAPARAA